MTQTYHISMTCDGHCVSTVSSDASSGEEAEMIHIFEIPDPNLSIHFVTFRALRRRLSHVIGKK